MQGTQVVLWLLLASVVVAQPSFDAIPRATFADPVMPAPSDSHTEAVTPVLVEDFFSAPVELAVPEVFTAVPTEAAEGLTGAAAHWVTPDLLLYNAGDVAEVRLYYSPIARLSHNTTSLSLFGAADSVRLVPRTLPASIAQRHPQLADWQAWGVPPSVDVKRWLKGQLAVGSRDRFERVLDATAVQTAGVLDAVYSARAAQMQLGALPYYAGTVFQLWAPTAQRVSLFLYDEQFELLERFPLREDSTSGNWSHLSRSAPHGRYYHYEVVAYHPATQKIETHRVTDPYSLNLSPDGQYSQVVDLDHPSLIPDGWTEWPNEQVTPAPEDAVLWRLALTHAQTLNPQDAPAFTHVHLYDPKATEKITGQARHFMLPPFAERGDEGLEAIRALRETVLRWRLAGYRVGIDGDFTRIHTFNDATSSMLDKIVPAYYHRRDPITGDALRDDCCAITATEHRMMERLLTDGLVQLAQAFGFESVRLYRADQLHREALMRSQVRVRNQHPAFFAYSDIPASERSPLASTGVGALTPVSLDVQQMPTTLTFDNRAEWRERTDAQRIAMAGRQQNYLLLTQTDRLMRGRNVPDGQYFAGLVNDPQETVHAINLSTLMLPGEHDTNDTTQQQRLRIALGLPLLSQGIIHLEGDVGQLTDDQRNALEEWLAVRQSTPLLRLTNQQQITSRIDFRNVGANQANGFMIMTINDGQGVPDLDPERNALMVILNMNTHSQTFRVPGFRLHPVQASGHDERLHNIAQPDDHFAIPGLSLVVLEQPQNGAQGRGMPIAQKDYSKLYPAE